MSQMLDCYCSLKILPQMTITNCARVKRVYRSARSFRNRIRCRALRFDLYFAFRDCFNDFLLTFEGLTFNPLRFVVFLSLKIYSCFGFFR